MNKPLYQQEPVGKDTNPTEDGSYLVISISNIYGVSGFVNGKWRYNDVKYWLRLLTKTVEEVQEEPKKLLESILPGLKVLRTVLKKAKLVYEPAEDMIKEVEEYIKQNPE